MNLRSQLHWFIYVIFLCSCARQSAPTGGPKDTIPPVLIKSLPPDETINFKGRTIEMTFSEMVALNNPKEQLIITPTIGKEFELTARNDKVVLELERPLADSTTYTFNFRESVQDVTEKNPVRNFQLALSTGPYIDSLSVSGVVTDLLRAKPVDNATVALHPRNDTFNILKHPATIFTKTSKTGAFVIEHLKPGEYFLYAFDDKNRNLIADSRNESYGFRAHYIHLTSDTAEIAIPLVRLDTRPLRITSARPSNTYFNIRTSKNLKAFSVKQPEGSKLLYSYGEDQSNVKFYKPQNLIADSIAVRFTASDSIENHIDTTLYVKFAERIATPEKFDHSITANTIIAATGRLNATVRFTKPLQAINFDSILFKVDSVTAITFTPDDTTWNIPSRTMTLVKTLDKSYFPSEPEFGEEAVPKPDTTPKPLQKIFELQLRRAAFIGADQDTSRAISSKSTVFKPDDLSMLVYTVIDANTEFIVQLLDKDKQVLRQHFNSRKGQFEDLPPGDYYLRVVQDINSNRKWDPGNYFNKQEPEPITYYKNEGGTDVINLRANFELVLTPMLITRR